MIPSPLTRHFGCRAPSCGSTHIDLGVLRRAPRPPGWLSSPAVDLAVRLRLVMVPRWITASHGILTKQDLNLPTPVDLAARSRLDTLVYSSPFGGPPSSSGAMWTWTAGAHQARGLEASRSLLRPRLATATVTHIARPESNGKRPHGSVDTVVGGRGIQGPTGPSQPGFYSFGRCRFK